ncbi:hypothetical protein LIA77_03129 [Sarocladium implicatum]|nr:hypothetical protein LIA77_03129 [Sarocladium implicatum]
MNSKNWNDRADKDLFFTILSVKNIGVISGSEWTTIGGHMRSLGYGFTNEGCRQHFQGLRRAQHKAEANGSTAESPLRVDPAMNPITRRPGPGRGRPKKQQAGDAPSEVPSSNAITETPATAPMAIMPEASMEPNQQVQGYQQAQQLLQRQTENGNGGIGSPIPTTLPMARSTPVASMVDTPNPTADPLKFESQDAEADAEGEPEADADGEEDTGEPMAKRRRMDAPEVAQHQPLDDEAVLQLAAHGDTDADGGQSEHYHPDFTYGET